MEGEAEWMVIVSSLVAHGICSLVHKASQTPDFKRVGFPWNHWPSIELSSKNKDAPGTKLGTPIFGIGLLSQTNTPEVDHISDNSVPSCYIDIHIKASLYI